MPYATVDRRRACFVQRLAVPETSPSVLFLHGAGGSHQHWLYQLRDLPGAPSYALDLPGHGRSEGPGRDSISAYADWVVAFMDSAKLGRAVIVGHSMGGGIALEMALRYPTRVAGLGLVATGARLRVAPAILDGILDDPAAAVRLISDFSFGPETPPELSRLGRRQLAATPPDVFHGDFEACNRYDVMDSLAQIDAPALVLCGTKDRLTPPKYSAHLHDGIKGSSLHLVEGAGHMVMVEKPAAVVGALTSFVGGLAATV